jgi:hypothetical protein
VGIDEGDADMADEKKGWSTGAVVGMAVGGLVLGIVGTAMVYELMVVPDAIEEATGGNKMKSGTGAST